MCPLPQPQPTFLRRDKAVFHHMGHADPDVEADDPRGPLQRMGRAHARLELIGRGGVPLERQQARGEHLRLRFRFNAEQIEQGKLTDIHAAQPRPRLSE